MPIYEFGCRQCGNVAETYASSPPPPPTCATCTSPMPRVFSFSVTLGTPAHFNLATGTYVRNDQHLKDEFTRLSDEASERLGWDQHYAPVDINDKEALGVTDEGLASTHDAHVAMGIKEPTVKLH